MKFRVKHFVINGNEYITALGSGKIRERFISTFGHKKGDRPSPKTLTDRKWIEQVIGLFADKMHVMFSQAVQSIETGNIRALQAVHQRKLEHAKTEEEYDLHASFAKIEPEDFYMLTRKHWQWALSIAHLDDKVSNASNSEYVQEFMKSNPYYASTILAEQLAQ